MKDSEKIQAINAALGEWFTLNKGVHTIQAKELMNVFISKGIFTANHKDGLPLRSLLRQLDNTNRLIEIPYVVTERKAKNVFWYFQRRDYQEESEQNNAPFNNTNLNKLKDKASTLKDVTTGYDYYAQALKAKPDPTTEEGLYHAISIAYSWMPTMLTIYMPKGNTLQDYLGHVQYFEKCKKGNMHRNTVEAREHFAALVSLINNSVVGASKVLHILYPNTVPIIDSRVIHGWNRFFAADIEQYPHVKILPSFESAQKERQIEEYFSYWNMLSKWMSATGINNIRELEEPFYIIGKEK